MKQIVAAMLAACVAGPVWAQTPVVIADIPENAFRALQRANTMKPGALWADQEVRTVRVAIIADGKIEASEQGVLDAMRKGVFEFTAQGRQSTLFKPKDIVVKGKVEASGLALLAVSEADLNASVNQQAGESRAAFLYRRGAEGVVEFAALMKNDPAARAEGRTLVAKRWDDAYGQAAGSGRGAEGSLSALRNAVNLELAKISQIPAGDQTAWKAFLQEAAIVTMKTHYKGPESFQGLFDGALTPQLESEIAKRIGLQ